MPPKSDLDRISEQRDKLLNHIYQQLGPDNYYQLARLSIRDFFGAIKKMNIKLLQYQQITVEDIEQCSNLRVDTPEDSVLCLGFGYYGTVFLCATEDNRNRYKLNSFLTCAIISKYQDGFYVKKVYADKYSIDGDEEKNCAKRKAETFAQANVRRFNNYYEMIGFEVPKAIIYDEYTCIMPYFNIRNPCFKDLPNNDMKNAIIEKMFSHYKYYLKDYGSTGNVYLLNVDPIKYRIPISYREWLHSPGYGRFIFIILDFDFYLSNNSFDEVGKYSGTDQLYNHYLPYSKKEFKQILSTEFDMWAMSKTGSSSMEKYIPGIQKKYGDNVYEKAPEKYNIEIEQYKNPAMSPIDLMFQEMDEKFDIHDYDYQFMQNIIKEQLNKQFMSPNIQGYQQVPTYINQSNFAIQNQSTIENEYECPLCSCGYLKKSSLTSQNQVLFQCNECGRRYKWDSNNSCWRSF